MVIRILSQQQISSYEEARPHVVVSISSPSFAATIPERSGRLGVLRIECHDIRSPHQKGTPFGPEMASAILDFVAAHRSRCQVVICQCEGGLSRSAGVAAALAHVLGEDEGRFWRGRYRPNSLVYDTILAEHKRRTRRS